MRILYLSPNGYLGGAESFVLDINHQHKKSGIASSILFFNDGEAVKKCQELGIPHKLLPFRLKLSRLSSITKSISYVREMIKLESYDIIHCTMPYAMLIGSPAAQFTSAKVVWFQHGPVGGLLDHLAMFYPVDLILFNSRYTMQMHNQLWGAGWQNCLKQTLALGVKQTEGNFAKAQEIRDEYLTGKQEVLCLSAGRICEWKGYHTSIKSMAFLREKNPELFNKYKLLIVGGAKRESDKVYQNYLKTLIEQFDLRDSVELIGHVENINDYLKATDIFIHSSAIPEPFGLIVAEAMINDCLVIGSQSGGVSDILINGKTGYTFPSTDINAEEPLVEILNGIGNSISIDFHIEMIKRAKQRIMEFHTTEKMEQNCVKIYEKLLKI
jgi:glycosyltransferase involved in cell wall biosynthesis